MRLFVRGFVSQSGLCCSTSPRVERWRQYQSVGLVDGSVPVIGTDKATITGLEPAVWFKVLVVDTLCIDLVEHCVKWTTCCYRNCPQRTMADIGYQRCKHTHECLLDEDYYLPDVDLQRGLELAKQILVRQGDDDQVDLLHLLHVYILPIIRLHSEDKDKVTQALNNQKRVLGELDSQIDRMTNQRKTIKENMRTWREDICSALQSESAIISCNTTFLKLLCQHLEADIRNAYVELDNCQKKVEEAKLKVQNREGQHYVSQLNKARATRDNVADSITRSLYVVEEVNFMIRLCKKPDSQQLSDMHQGYMKIQEEWQGYTKELTELQRKKICATSVREALVNTEAELAEGGDTAGIEISSDGIGRPTDVLEEGSLPSGWETLQAQVAKSLEMNTVIMDLHRQFRSWIRQYCNTELKNDNSGCSWRGKIPSCKLQCTQIEESATATCLKISPDNFTVLRRSIRERQPSTHYQGLCKTLQNEVFLHLQDVVDQLVKDPAVPSTCFSRLWTCYERCLFSTMSQDILQFYKMAYAVSSKKLQRILPHVTIRDLQLDDEWILNILGLFAPDFMPPLSDGGVEIRVDADEGSTEMIGEETDPEKDSLTDVGSRSRERLESGISLPGVDGAVPRRPSQSRRDEAQRNSNRFTKIIDLTWVTSPPASADRSPWSERSATWSGMDWEERRSRGEGMSVDSLSSSTPSTGSEAGSSRSIDVPNTNSNARTLPTPITSCVGDSGVCLNVPRDGFHHPPPPPGTEPSPPRGSDPLGKRCHDNPNARVFLQRFQQAYHCFQVVLQETVPMTKLQWLYKCIQEVNATAEKQSQLIFCGKLRMLSGDDLLTTLILFLLHGNAEEIANGYTHLMLLQDYLPDFLDKGHFGFTVLQFLLAYNYLLDYEKKHSDPS